MSPPVEQRRLWRTHLFVLAVYLILVVAATWPLATRILTHVPGDGIDDPALAWNLWWIKARLVEQGSPRIFAVDWMFYPLGINLAFYTLTPLRGLLSIPLQSGTSLTLANNLLLWLHFVLAGYGTFLLTRWLPAAGSTCARTLWIPLFAGAIYAFASAKLFYAALGQFNIVGSHWIPFCVLFLLRMVDRARTGRVDARSILLAGLFFGFQAWVELTYASFLLIFSAVLFVWALLSTYQANEGSDERWRAFRAQMFSFAAVGAVMLVTLIPFLVAMVPDLLREGDFFASGGGFADVFSADLAGYLVPTRLHPWLGTWVATLPFPNDKGQHIFVGYSVAALACLGLGALLSRPTRRREGWLWLTLLLLFWLLTLGPTIRLLGNDTGIPGPFGLVSRLPFFSGNRYPSRYSVMLLLCAAVTAAYGLDVLRTMAMRRRWKISRALAMAVVALVFAFEHLSMPLPLNDFRIPSLYTRLAADARSGDTLLELPTGWRNGARVLGKSDILIMMQQWYQTEHEYRRLGGNTSRNPAYTFQYFTDAPVIGDLIALMNSDDERIGNQVRTEWESIAARGEAHGAAVLDFLDVGAVTLHVEAAPELLIRYVDEILPLTVVDEWTGVDWRGKAATIRLYRPAAAAADPATRVVDLAGPLGTLYLAAGWSALPTDAGIRYAVRPTVELMLDLPQGGSRLLFELRGAPGPVSMEINGRSLGTVMLGESGLLAVDLPVPPGVADQPVDRFRLRFGSAAYPAAWAAEPSMSGQAVGATGISMDSGTAIFVRSAGEEVGDAAEIRVQGVNHAPNRRGYNLVALTGGGDVLGAETFDTFADSAESARMAEWLASWPAGTMIAGAVADEASLHLTDEAVGALAALGVAGDLREHFRWSHAFVGAVGAPPGSALERMELLRPAVVTIGVPVNSDTVYGGIGTIVIVPQN